MTTTRRAAALLLLGLLLPLPPSFAQPADVYDRPRRAERSRTFDALHYRIALRFDEAARSFWGETTLTLSPLRDDFREAVLDAETFTVTEVRGETGAALAFEQGDGRLQVRLPRAYAYGDTLSFTVAYEAHEVDVRAEAFGMDAGYDLGLDFKAATDANPRLVNTLSFPEGARHWFPCYDHPNDRATQETLVTVRRDYQALSNGRLVEVTEDAAAGTRTFHWAQEQPHPTYLFVVVAGPYVVLEDALGALPIHYWVYEKDVPDALRSFGKTPAILAFFEEEYGVAYPWVKYDQVTIPGIGGGAESTTATVVGHSTIHDARAEQDFPSHWLVAHEAAHQWWGNLVSYRDWSQTWLSESFATYGEYRWSRHDLGEDEGALNLFEKKNAYLREAAARYARPIVFDRWRYPNENFDRHTYQKGAAVLHMLRAVLGEAPFRRSLKHFLTRHAYQPVDTHDLMTAIKEATGQNLDWFFEQWIFSPGHPVFDVAYTWDEAARKIQLTVAQRQDTTRGVPIFRMPVQIGLVTPEGRRTERVWLNARENVFTFESAHRPLLVRFDEGDVLLKEWTFHKALDELLYQLAHDDAMGRRWAAQALSGYRDDARAVDALRTAARNDAFWAVRRQAVETLGTRPDPAFVAFFKTAAEDPHARVRAAALAALGTYGVPALAAFFQERFEADDSYVAQAAALRALGQSADADALPFLERAATMPSPRDVLKNAAAGALAQVRAREED